MKTARDPRHRKREEAIKSLFALNFKQKVGRENNLVGKILPQVERIDKLIAKTAPEWPLSQVNKIDLAILRLAVYELTVAKKEPAKAIIDEAVELGKKYGGESSPKFINGVLGTILRKNLTLVKENGRNN